MCFMLPFSLIVSTLDTRDFRKVDLYSLTSSVIVGVLSFHFVGILRYASITLGYVSLINLDS